MIFEPDYCWEGTLKAIGYLTEIYINTLHPEEYEAFKNIFMDGSTENLSIVDENLKRTLNSVYGKPSLEHLIEAKVNREQRRHGVFEKDGYKRPRSNKKLYEY